MRRLFKIVVIIHATIYRLSGGRLGVTIGGMGMLILTTTGRRSGKPRAVPLGYMMENDSYVVIASYGGSTTNPAWYLNLINEPRAFVQVKGHKVAVTAQKVEAADREQLWSRLIAKAPLYQKFQDRTKRQIPMVFLTPAT
jgi:deazaflavin-dependent oxidoreductase (nitroreductase family)